jgi:hypothetical protein
VVALLSGQCLGRLRRRWSGGRFDMNTCECDIILIDCAAGRILRRHGTRSRSATTRRGGRITYTDAQTTRTAIRVLHCISLLEILNDILVLVVVIVRVAIATRMDIVVVVVDHLFDVHVDAFLNTTLIFVNVSHFLLLVVIVGNIVGLTAAEFVRSAARLVLAVTVLIVLVVVVVLAHLLQNLVHLEVGVEVVYVVYD